MAYLLYYRKTTFTFFYDCHHIVIDYCHKKKSTTCLIIIFKFVLLKVFGFMEEREVICLQAMPKCHFTVISRCMNTHVPLDVTINLHSFLCVQCLSIKFPFIIE